MFRSKIIRDGNVELYGMPSFGEYSAEDEGDAAASDALQEAPPPDPRVLLEEIEKQARTNAEELEKEAYRKGFNAGQEAGTNEGLQKAGNTAQPLIEELSQIVSELKELKKKILAEVEPQVVDLAVALARKTIAYELSLNSGIMLDIVKAAFNKMEKVGRITIRIHPDTLDIFLKGKETLTGIHPEIVFETDSSIPLQGAHIEGTTEEVIADVNELFDNAVGEMKDNLVIG
ncbi:MAG: hypothetical protein HQK89_02020 [Nitrospirae bacterium]|nr:hypothetical protein [Nitrospirota bacterium]